MRAYVVITAGPGKARGLKQSSIHNLAHRRLWIHVPYIRAQDIHIHSAGIR